MKIKGVVKEDFLQQLNKMVFKVFYPFMTFYNIYKADASSLPRPVMLIFCGVSILVLEVILVLTVPRLVKENPRRGVIIQAIYRSNFVLFGLPLDCFCVRGCGLLCGGHGGDCGNYHL